MKRGVPPTAENARTGELTPPGMAWVARVNSAAEAAVPGAGVAAAEGVTAYSVPNGTG